MKKLLLVPICFSAIMLTTCKSNNDLQYETFNAEAIITVSKVEFTAEITEKYVKFISENLSEPLYFENDTITIGNISAEIIPQEDSVFHLNNLLIEVLKSGKSRGYYRNIEYFCEFDETTKKPEKIFWGDVSIEFKFFKQGSLK